MPFLSQHLARSVIGLAASHITGSNDLLTTFGLAHAYDSAVKPYLNLSLPGDVKGKGRATDDDGVPGSISASKQEEGAGTVREKGKTMKKHYNHMIADVPGKFCFEMQMCRPMEAILT